MLKFLALCFCAFCASGAGARPEEVLEVVRLKKLDVGELTVSGLSSGAYMAVQFHVSHSRAVNGSAIFAGGPFYCAESNLEYAEHKCMDNQLGYPEVDKLVELTRTDAALGFVDDPDRHLKNSHVYLFSGKDDSVVSQSVAKALLEYYEAFVDPTNIVADFNEAAEHCLPTLNYGVPCTILESPYIGNCNFDGAERALRTLYGGDSHGEFKSSHGEQQDEEKFTAKVGENLFAFDQTEYFIQDGLSSIGDVGYIYIPQACQQGATHCKLHVSFHGCKQNLELIGNEYAKNGGFNEYAEMNNIVVVYPYVRMSHAIPYNPKGCWDWWAYTGVYYGTKRGLQIEFVKNILLRLGYDM